MNSINNISFKGKRALIRTDFNIPLDRNNNISDNTRIVSSLPTIKHVLSKGGSCILVSHLGRPKGFDSKLSLKIVQHELEELLDQEVKFLSDYNNKSAIEFCSKLKDGDVVLLENIRFYPEEINSNELFAKQLSSFADIYINDAFGTSHRKHSSTFAVAKYFNKKCPGILLQKEIHSINKVLSGPEKPVTAIIGGAKVSSKISVILNILRVVDNLIIGGGMAYTFIKSKGGEIGDSIFEKDLLSACQEIIISAKKKNVNVFLPSDVVASENFSDSAKKTTVKIDKIPNGWQGLDIGPKTRNQFSKIILESNTILWNGPMGVFEMSSFEKGTSAVASAVASATSKGAFSLVGGGDSIAALKKFNLQKSISYISTGGGAMLESLEGKTLPGINALRDKL